MGQQKHVLQNSVERKEIEDNDFGYKGPPDYKNTVKISKMQENMFEDRSSNGQQPMKNGNKQK